EHTKYTEKPAQWSRSIIGGFHFRVFWVFRGHLRSEQAEIDVALEDADAVADGTVHPRGVDELQIEAAVLVEVGLSKDLEGGAVLKGHALHEDVDFHTGVVGEVVHDDGHADELAAVGVNLQDIHRGVGNGGGAHGAHGGVAEDRTVFAEAGDEVAFVHVAGADREAGATAGKRALVHEQHALVHLDEPVVGDEGVVPGDGGVVEAG